MRIDPLDDFAVEVKNQPQHAMRGRMLRTEIDRESADCLAHVKSASRRSVIAGCGLAFSSPGS